MVPTGPLASLRSPLQSNPLLTSGTGRRSRRACPERASEARSRTGDRLTIARRFQRRVHAAKRHRVPEARLNLFTWCLAHFQNTRVFFPQLTRCQAKTKTKIAIPSAQSKYTFQPALKNHSQTVKIDVVVFSDQQYRIASQFNAPANSLFRNIFGANPFPSIFCREQGISKSDNPNRINILSASI